MGEHGIIDLLRLQTLLIAVGVAMYGWRLGLHTTCGGEAITLWFLVAVFLSSGARLFYNSGARYLAADSSE
jgi:high-affinity Fe2+/Pb2+ permease